MGTPKRFKFYLKDASGLYYAVDTNDNKVITTNTKRALSYSPANWNELEIIYGRDETTLGIFRKATTELMFVKDAAKILRDLYYSQGANYFAYALLVIERRIDDDPMRVWQYEEFYSAEIDFTNEMIDGVNDTGDFFQCHTIEGGLPKALKDKMDMPIEISLDDGVIINLDGVESASIVKYQVTDGSDPNMKVDNHVIDMQILNVKGITYRDTISQDRFKFGNLSTDVIGQQRWIYKASVAGTIGINYSIQYWLNPNGGTAPGFSGQTLKTSFLRVRAGVSQAFDIISNNNAADYLVNYQGVQNHIAIDMQKDDELYFVTFFTPGNGNTQVVEFNYEFGTVELQYYTRAPATDIRAYQYKDLVKKACELAFGNQYQVLSTALAKTVPFADLQHFNNWNNAPTYTYVTSGTELRGVSGAVIKTTLRDIFQDMWSRWMISCSVRPSNTNQLHIEQLPYFFNKSSVIATIQEIRALKKYTAKEFLYSDIVAGYPVSIDDKINSEFEFNTEVKYKIPIATYKKELDLMSSFIASIFDIESIRAERFKDPIDESTARTSDNGVYLVECNPQPVAGKYQLIRYGALQIQGVFSKATHYNWGLMPQFFIRRWRPYFKSILNRPDSDIGTQPMIEFRSAKHNDEQIMYINNVFVIGNSNIAVSPPSDGTAPKQLFKPLIFEFDCSPTENLLKLIQDKPFGVIEFYDRGVKHAGFILDVGVKIGSKEAYTFKLLCSPDDDTAAFR